MSATSFRRKRNSYRLSKSDRDTVADLNALQRVYIRHVYVFCRTIGSLQCDALIGLVDRRDYDDESLPPGKFRLLPKYREIDREPGRATAVRSRSIPADEEALDDILVELEAEGIRDLLGDLAAAEVLVSPFHPDHRVDQLW